MREEYPGRGPRNQDFVVIYNTGNGYERTVLTRSFNVTANHEKAYIKLSNALGEKFEIELTANAAAMDPEGMELSMTEKLLLRLEEALAGRTSRVDLRFCTGTAQQRNPRHDNLHPEYQGPRPG